MYNFYDYDNYVNMSLKMRSLNLKGKLKSSEKQLPMNMKETLEKKYNEP